MIGLYLFKTFAGLLRPADGASEEALKEMAPGEIIRFEAKRERNPAHHRLFFGLLKMVYENQERYLSQEALRFAITCQAGWVEEIQLSGDRVALKPKSISWGSMAQSEFGEYFQAALRAIPQLLPQFEGVDLEAELRSQ